MQIEYHFLPNRSASTWQKWHGCGMAHQAECLADSNANEQTTHFQITYRQHTSRSAIQNGLTMPICSTAERYVIVQLLHFRWLHVFTASYITQSHNEPWASRTMRCWFSLSEEVKCTQDDKWKCTMQAGEYGGGCVMVRQLCGSCACFCAGGGSHAKSKLLKKEKKSNLWLQWCLKTAPWNSAVLMLCHLEQQ